MRRGGEGVGRRPNLCVVSELGEDFDFDFTNLLARWARVWGVASPAAAAAAAKCLWWGGGISTGGVGSICMLGP